MLRILITGSRHWNLRKSIYTRITETIKDYIEDNPHLAQGPLDWVSIVHGNCPYGADRIADDFAEKILKKTPERYDADWKQFKKRAGYIRNQRMVNSAPDVCLAFIRDKSNGSTMCRDLARSAGMFPQTFLYEDEVEIFPVDPTVPVKYPRIN